MNHLELTDEIREEIDTTCPCCDGTGQRKLDDLDEEDRGVVIDAWKLQRQDDATEEEIEEFYEKLQKSQPDKENAAWKDFADLTETELAEITTRFGSAQEPDDDTLEEYYTDEGDFDFSCDECTDGYCEILWNTAFGISRYKDAGDWETARRFAWKCNGGFLLFEHNDEYWLGMGSCGQDNTWLIHYCRWKLQGYLDREDIERCFSSGGWCFLGAAEKEEMLDYFESRIPTPEELLVGRQQQVDQIARIRNIG